MAFSEQFLDELTARSDIVQVISRYVSLTRRGSSHIGLCPFHNEKTPSFHVSADKQFFHCFGCGVGGGVVSFVMRAENLSFPDAVEKLAQWAGLTVPEQSGADFTMRKKRERALELSRDAAMFYHETLKSAVGGEALSYMTGRGLTSATLKAFGIGFAPPGWSSLIDAMTEKGYTKAELYDAGLTILNKSGGYYDRFRNRVMFPIIDIRGSVIGFGGRVMDSSEPKYLNSPETILFNKRKNLFALNFARKSKDDFMILAEGYMDVISLHQAGFGSAVASLGTSLTEEQARIISRYKNRAVIAYDSDNAGVNAAERAIELLKKTGITVKVLRMTGAKDPDEYIKKYGREKFARLLDSSEGDTEYRLSSIKSKFDLQDDKQRIEYLKSAVEQLARLPSPIEREIYISRVAEAANISKDAVAAEVARKRKSFISKSRKEQERRDLSPVNKVMPAARGLRYHNPKSAVAEEGLVALLFGRHELIPKSIERLKPESFSSELLAKLYELMTEQHNSGHELTMTGISASFTPEETEHIAAVFARHNGEESCALDDYIETIKKESIEKTANENDTDVLLLAAEFYRKKKGYGG